MIPHIRSFAVRSLIFFAPFLLLLAGCAGQMSSNSIARQQDREKVLKVGVTANAPPFVFRKGGKITGLEVDFAKQIGLHIGKEVQLVDLPWKQLIPALEDGRIDMIMSGMTITQKRLYRVTFTKPYFRSGQIMLVRGDEARRYSSGIYDIMGKNPKIGTIRNTTGDFFISETINKPRLTRFSKPDNAVKALINKDIDVFVHDAPIICHYASVYETKRLTPILQMATEEYLAWAVNKNNDALLEELNSFLEVNTQNQNVKKTIKKWIPYL